MLLFFVVGDGEVLELIRLLGVGNDANVVPKVLLLQELLSEVLEVSLGDRDLGVNNDDGVVAGDGDAVSEKTGLVVDLDLLLQELLKGSGFHDSVLDGDRAVNLEVELNLLGLLLFVVLKKRGR